jgi:hypothetical protein
METIDKLRAMHSWYDMQSESMNYQFKSIKGMEMAFDYAIKNNLEFIDNDYLISGIFSNDEIKTHIQKIKKFQNL